MCGKDIPVTVKRELCREYDKTLSQILLGCSKRTGNNEYKRNDRRESKKQQKSKVENIEQAASKRSILYHKCLSFKLDYTLFAAFLGQIVRRKHKQDPNNGFK